MLARRYRPGRRRPDRRPAVPAGRRRLRGAVRGDPRGGRRLVGRACSARHRRPVRRHRVAGAARRTTTAATCAPSTSWVLPSPSGRRSSSGPRWPACRRCRCVASCPPSRRRPTARCAGHCRPTDAAAVYRAGRAAAHHAGQAADGRDPAGAEGLLRAGQPSRCSRSAPPGAASSWTGWGCCPRRVPVPVPPAGRPDHRAVRRRGAPALAAGAEHAGRPVQPQAGADPAARRAAGRRPRARCTGGTGPTSRRPRTR